MPFLVEFNLNSDTILKTDKLKKNIYKINIYIIGFVAVHRYDDRDRKQ